MSWKASSVMEARVRLVLEYERGDATMADLCRAYEVSRETGYYWLHRYRRGGVESLQDMDRAPQRHPNQTAGEVEQQVLELRRTQPYTQPFAMADAPNRVWCADFKGWFRTQDGERVDPLTITDAHSRYLLRCQAVEKADHERVRAICEAAFREYGMPQAMRSDNGAPFASPR